MSVSSIPSALRRQIFERDQRRCRYCMLSQVGQAAVFHVNHVVPRSKGGATTAENLVLQCPHCSLHKSDKTAGVDPVTGDAAALFHPLQQAWADHFVVRPSGICEGLTSVGRVTVAALRMNDPLPRIARLMQVRHGLLRASEGGAEHP